MTQSHRLHGIVTDRKVLRQSLYVTASLVNTMPDLFNGWKDQARSKNWTVPYPVTFMNIATAAEGEAPAMIPVEFFLAHIFRILPQLGYCLLQLQYGYRTTQARKLGTASHALAIVGVELHCVRRAAVWRGQVPAAVD